MTDHTKELLDNLKNYDEDIRRMAAEELLKHSSETVIDALVDALNDSSRAVAEAAQATLAGIRGVIVIQKAIPLLASEHAKLRNLSFEMLCEIGGDSLEEMINLLKDNDRDLRKFATDILGELCDPRSVNALIEAMEDSDVNVAAGAAESLGKIRDPKAVPELIRRLDRDVWMQCSVIKSLSGFDDTRATEALVNILPLLSGMSLYSAVTAIGEVGDKQVIPTLIELLNTDNKAFQGAIVTALDKIMKRADDEIINSSNYKINIDQLLSVLEAADIQTKINVISILGWLKNERAIKPLLSEFINAELNVAMLDCKQDIKQHLFGAIVNINPADLSHIIFAIESITTPDEIKAELIDVLGTLKAESAIESLLSLKDTPNKILRRVLARTFGLIKHPEATSALKKYLKDPEGHTRGNSAKSLGKLREESAIDDLVALFDDPYPNIRLDATDALAQIGGEAVIKKLSEVLAHSANHDEIRLALLSMGKIDSLKSMNILIDYLKDDDPQLRKITVEAVSEHHANNFSAELLQMIGDEDNEVKIAVIKGLSKSAPDLVAPKLLESLKKCDSLKIKYHLVEALGNMRVNEATGALIELLDDNSTVTVLSAAEALGKIGDARALEPLQKLCKSSDKDIATTAKEAVTYLDRGF